MGMYEVAAPGTMDLWMGNFVQDGIFWQFLAYCAGTGGSAPHHRLRCRCGGHGT